MTARQWTCKLLDLSKNDWSIPSDGAASANRVVGCQAPLFASPPLTGINDVGEKAPLLPDAKKKSSVKYTTSRVITLATAIGRCPSVQLPCPSDTCCSAPK